MTKRMFKPSEVYKVSQYWYGRTDDDSLCLAENRLNRGEVPYGGF